DPILKRSRRLELPAGSARRRPPARARSLQAMRRHGRRSTWPLGGEATLPLQISREAARARRTPHADAFDNGVTAGREAWSVLLLSRRESERVLSRDVGVTVELMAVTGNRARLGISAPDNIRILREEVAASQEAIKHAATRGPLSREFSHAIRNR